MTHVILEEIKQTIDSIRKTLEIYRSEHKLAYSLRVSDEEYVQEGEWLYVVVTPSVKGIRASDFTELLSEVEENLPTNNSYKIMLVPGKPE